MTDVKPFAVVTEAAGHAEVRVNHGLIYESSDALLAHATAYVLNAAHEAACARREREAARRALIEAADAVFKIWAADDSWCGYEECVRDEICAMLRSRAAAIADGTVGV